MDTDKPRICIYMPGVTMVRNFMLTDAFAEVERSCAVTYLVPDDPAVRDHEVWRTRQVRAYLFKGHPSLWRTMLMRLFCFRAARASATYRRAYYTVRGLPRGKGWLYLLLSPGPVYRALLRAVEWFMPVPQSLLTLLRELRPDQLLILAGSPGSAEFDLFKAARCTGASCGVIAPGWDNISSKFWFYLTPNFIVERGEQNAQCAAGVLEMPRERIAVAGVPHYEMYYSYAQERASYLAARGIDPSRTVLLFGGSLRPFDETSFLEVLDAAIADGRIPEAHVIYRPHPERDRRLHEKSFFEARFSHVTFDEELRHAYQHHKSNYQPLLENYPPLYNAIDAIISPFSSVMVEAALFGKPVLGLACSDGVHAGAVAVQEMSQREHFRYLKDRRWFVKCTDRARFVDDCAALVARARETGLDREIKRDVECVVYHDGRSYAARMNDIVHRYLRTQGASL